MIGIFRAKAEVRAAHGVIDVTLPKIRGDDLATRVAAVIAHLCYRATMAEQECERLRRTYEPTRNRVMLPDGSTVVQPTGVRVSA